MSFLYFIISIFSYMKDAKIYLKIVTCLSLSHVYLNGATKILTLRFNLLVVSQN